MITRQTEKLLDTAMAIADPAAQDRGDLGFTAPVHHAA